MPDETLRGGGGAGGRGKGLYGGRGVYWCVGEGGEG